MSPVILMMIFVIWWTSFKGDRKARARNIDVGGKRHCSIMDVIEATEYFNPLKKVGEGRFGTVYKAELPHRGPVVAVKKLSNLTQQRKLEFDSEVDTLKKLNHANIVKLFAGYFNSTSKLQLMVYEYTGHCSLSKALSDPALKDKLQWGTRYNICLGIAKGLDYLHSYPRRKIIHQNMTSNNILLDETWKPKISDVRLTNLFSVFADPPLNSYWPPEYYDNDSGKITEKSDVFGFGVILLEILRGRSSLNYENHVSDMLAELFKLQGRGRLWDFIDGELRFEADEVQEVLNLAIMCVEISHQRRPNMKQALAVLNHAITTEQLSKEILTQSLTELDHGIATEELFDEIIGDMKGSMIARERIIDIGGRFYSIMDVIEPTKYFSPKTKVGEGRFGIVYKAKLSYRGPVVAVKRISKFTGEIKKLFYREVDFLQELNDVNIVRLLAGYFNPFSELKLLVYEYMHRSLSEALSDPTLKDELSWSRRYNICRGIAKGLEYLHKYPRFTIIHGNMTSNNILLDKRWEPKISDVRLTNIFRQRHQLEHRRILLDERWESTGISKARLTNISSNNPFEWSSQSPGYPHGEVAELINRSGHHLQPRDSVYRHPGREEIPEEVDVIVFGGVLLEIVSGKRAVDVLESGDVVLDKKLMSKTKGLLLDLVDSELRSYNREEAYMVLKLAVMCVGRMARFRPSMSQAVNVLEGQMTIETLSAYIAWGKSTFI